MTAEKNFPVDDLLQDPQVSEIMIDGYQQVRVERDGQLEDVPSPFADQAALDAFANHLAETYGVPLNESNPLVDLRLPGGMRVNIVLPPIARQGPVITMRKAIRRSLTLEELISYGSISQGIADFLKICVQARLNILVAGGTGAGKTTILHLLGTWIPADERIVILQNDEEFSLPQPRAVILETRPANLEGQGEVSMTTLVRNATHMRPDRIVVVEVYGAEAFELLTALNMGHDGSMFSLHASSLRDALSRLEVMAGYANPALPLLTLREQIASAVNLVMYQERLPDGGRRIVKIAEVTGLQDGVVMTKDLFEFRRTGVQDGRIQGMFTATGAIPSFLSTLRQYGIDMPVSWFTPV